MFISFQSLPLYAFQVLNGAGDLLDLVNVVSPKNQPDWRKMTKEEAVAFVARSGHCSALIKVSEDSKFMVNGYTFRGSNSTFFPLLLPFTIGVSS